MYIIRRIFETVIARVIRHLGANSVSLIDKFNILFTYLRKERCCNVANKTRDFKRGKRFGLNDIFVNTCAPAEFDSWQSKF